MIIAAHGNSLRALVKYLDNISEEEIVELNIPTGMPLVYELDDDLKPLSRYYLGDPAKVKAAMDAVAAQGQEEVIRGGEAALLPYTSKGSLRTRLPVAANTAFATAAATGAAGCSPKPPKPAVLGRMCVSIAGASPIPTTRKS